MLSLIMTWKFSQSCEVDFRVDLVCLRHTKLSWILEIFFSGFPACCMRLAGNFSTRLQCRIAKTNGLAFRHKKVGRVCIFLKWVGDRWRKVYRPRHKLDFANAGTASLHPVIIQGWLRVVSILYFPYVLFSTCAAFG